MWMNYIWMNCFYEWITSVYMIYIYLITNIANWLKFLRNKTVTNKYSKVLRWYTCSCNLEIYVQPFCFMRCPYSAWVLTLCSFLTAIISLGILYSYRPSSSLFFTSTRQVWVSDTYMNLQFSPSECIKMINITYFLGIWTAEVLGRCQTSLLYFQNGNDCWKYMYSYM